jgi:hypothetical protein
MSAFPRHAPTCLHAPFSIDRGDRARRSYAEALEIALRRVPRRGRQTVRRHVGPFFRDGVWFVQDADRSAS